MQGQRVGRREVDQHVAAPGEPAGLVAAGAAAGKGRVGPVVEQGGDRPAHSPRRAQDADPSHLFPHVRAFMSDPLLRRKGTAVPGGELWARNETRSPVHGRT
jgi:hypothetical protein